MAIVVAASSMVASTTHAAGDSVVPGTPPSSVIISIVGTSDLHGHLEALPRFGAYLTNLRRARAREGGGVVLLDGGDIFHGTLDSNLNEGAAAVAAYNALRYDAVAIGNHEFDFGPVGPAHTPGAPGDDPQGALKARASEAHFPFLAANLVDAATGKPPAWPNVRTSTTVSVGAVTVGVIGLANAATASITLPANFAGLRALPLGPAVVAEAKELRRRGAAAVVVVAHVGGACTQFTQSDDLSSCNADSEIFQLARALPAGTIDAIVAGHTHAGIAHRVAGIPIIESYANGRAFGRVDLTVDLAPRRARGRGHAKGRPAVVEAHLFPPQDLAKPGFSFFGTYEGVPLAADPDVEAAIAPALAAARAKRDAKLGVTIAHPIAPAYATESALGNLFADLMRAARPKADVAVTSGGSLRAELPAGPLTYGQLHEALPFDDRFATISITGGDLAATIARNLARAGGVVSLSGLRAQAACVDGALQVTLSRPAGTPVGAGERLTLVTSEFLATGGGGVFSDEVRAGATPAAGPTIRDAMADLLRARRAPLDPDNPPLYDAAHPRLGYAGKRPLTCR